MKTIGELIKNKRFKKKYSRAKLEKETRIKKEFIKALEEGNWKDLPEQTVVKGFVKNIASFLKIDQKQASALLRRDYPSREVNINPKQVVQEKSLWSPKTTFTLGVLLVGFIVLGYLGFQYINFIRSPSLKVDLPKEGEIVKKKDLTVSGKTDSEATLKVNNQPVLVGRDGSFATDIEVF